MTHIYNPKGKTLEKLIDVGARLAKANRDYEELYVIDSINGSMVYYEVGERTSVPIKIEDRPLCYANVIIHSHPNFSNSVLSPEDIIYTLAYRAWAMIAVTRYEMSAIRLAVEIPDDVRERMITDMELISSILELDDMEIFENIFQAPTLEVALYKWAARFSDYVEYSLHNFDTGTEVRNMK